MRLQSGQVAAMPCWRSQGWMHSEWKLCWQGSVVTLLHSGYPSRQTEHSLAPMLPVLCGPCTATRAQHAYCRRSLTHVSEYAAQPGSVPPALLMSKPQDLHPEQEWPKSKPQ